MKLTRYPGNPILTPISRDSWQSEATFNGCITQVGNNYRMLYRAQARPTRVGDKMLELSTIGSATSSDRITFSGRQQLITPEYPWEKFGCEDPRVTFVDNKYYIFYTALSEFPPDATSIKVAVAVSSDLKTIAEKHLVTPFNAKAMALFPERIQGKLTALVTAHTDMPPAKICLVQFDAPQQIWESTFWNKWYTQLDAHSLPLLRTPYDHIELGAPPIKTAAGWLVIYSYIRSYTTSNKLFGIEALLLDLEDPFQVVGRTQEPLLTPETDYERVGKVTDVIFPTGALIHNSQLGVYYGAADTTVCLATTSIQTLIESMQPQPVQHVFNQVSSVKRFSGNPIITPILEHSWEDKFTLNPAAIYLNNKVHILYRAMGKHDTSVIGYAASDDGVHISERLTSPIYMPREEFERKLTPGYSGCEDPRLTQFGDTIYMCYTAFDSKNPTRVALTSTTTTDFLQKKWNWSRPTLISPPGMGDKNACLFPEKINNKYVFFHRLHHSIWIDFVDTLEFGSGKWLGGEVILQPQPRTWYSEKIGIGPPPIKTAAGWLLIFHGLSKEDNKYRLGAVLLNLENPSRVEAKLDDPILSPHTQYESSGLRPGTVFSCGAVVINSSILIYYGAADQVICVASIEMKDLLNNLQSMKVRL